MLIFDNLMKIISTSITAIFNTPIKFIERDESYFTSSFHSHPEFELVYIKEGYGKRIIGTKVDEFKEGELVLIGPNVQHIWINDSSFYKADCLKRSKAIVAYFNPNIFSDFFYQMEEVAQINKLFTKAKYGIEITGNTKNQTILKLEKIIKAQGINKIIQLLDILNNLSISNEFYYINQQITENHLRSSDRLTSLFNYVNINYKKNISLKDAAKIMHLTPESFCRFFKQKTSKNFINYLHETRISFASQSLLNTDLSIAEIAYENGFTTVSNFNRLFKKITGHRPSEFRKAITLN